LILKKYSVQLLTNIILLLSKTSIFVLPLFFGLIFLKPKFVFKYSETLRKLRIHHKALSQGPVQRFVESFFAVRLNQSDQISGACTQCGNCCLNKQCAFLEPIDNGNFQCGVYNSPFRKFSNCGAFPISGEDIERYDCPGYVVSPYPVIKLLPVNVKTLKY
jgi:hypothetical protein